jgi:hypothetical protein
MMLSFLTSTVFTGLLSGILGAATAHLKSSTDIKMKQLEWAQENKVREFEERMRDKDLAHQIAMRGVEAQQKIEESHSTAMAAMETSMHEHFSDIVSELTKPTVSPWADLANAWTRPVINYTMTALFMIGILCYMFGWGNMNPAFASALGTAFIDLWAAITFFVYGSREYHKRQGASTMFKAS